jgi:flagellar biosynthesis protein FlhG
MDTNNSDGQKRPLFKLRTQNNRRIASEILANFSQTNLSNTIGKRIWAIGGGKGGVGKSLVSANTAIILANAGHKVVAIDLDLGGANLHTCLGVPIPKNTLSDYLCKKVISINDTIVKTSIPNLSVISGAQDEIGIANLKSIHKNKILRSLEEIEADFIILDLGAGTAANTLDFFIAADRGILVALPEPTSIENTYRFIKSVFFRRLSMFDETFDLQHIIDKAQGAKINQGMSSPRALLEKVREISPNTCDFITREMEKMEFQLILNQVRSHKDKDLGHAIQKICSTHFSIQTKYCGFLDYDSAVWQSVKMREPLLKSFPNSLVATNLHRITHNLLKDLQ